MSKENKNPYEYCKEHRTISVKTTAGCPLCLQAKLATAQEEIEDLRKTVKAKDTIIDQLDQFIPPLTPFRKKESKL